MNQTQELAKEMLHLKSKMRVNYVQAHYDAQFVKTQIESVLTILQKVPELHLQMSDLLEATKEYIVALDKIIYKLS